MHKVTIYRYFTNRQDILYGTNHNYIVLHAFFDASDKYSTHVCNKCGLIASYNDDTSKRIHTKNDMTIHLCRTCGNTVDFSRVDIPYSFKLLSQELQTINVVPRLITE